MQDLKSEIVEWNSLQQKIDEYHNLLSTYKEKSKKLEENILGILEKNKIDNKKFVLNDHTISCKDSNKYENITKKYLDDTLKKYFNNDERISKRCLEFIYKEREIVKVKSLIRLKNRFKNKKQN